LPYFVSVEECFSLLDRLIARHNCVIIPGFGGFVGAYRPARLSASEGRLTPPGKSVAFNPRLTRQDGLLAHALAESRGLAYDAAERRVDEFAQQCQSALRQHRQLRVPGLGKLLLDEGDKVRFAPDERDNLLPDAFGLPVLDAAPFLRSREATMEALREDRDQDAKAPVALREEPVMQDWSPRRWGWAAAVLLLLVGAWQILVVTDRMPESLAVLSLPVDRSPRIEEGKAAVLHPLVPSLPRQMARYGRTTPLSSTAPRAWLLSDSSTLILEPSRANETPTAVSLDDRITVSPATEPAVAVAPAARAPEETPRAGTPAIVEASTTPTLQEPAKPGYYLVIGSYPSRSAALERLERSGHEGPTALLRASNGNYRASLWISDSEEVVWARLDALRDQHRQTDAWILGHRAR
jgi:nucleoid DNA-binding protein